MREEERIDRSKIQEYQTKLVASKLSSAFEKNMPTFPWWNPFRLMGWYVSRKLRQASDQLAREALALKQEILAERSRDESE